MSSSSPWAAFPPGPGRRADPASGGDCALTAGRRIAVPPDKAGERLDRFLAEALPDLSRSRIQQLIVEGHVLVGSAPARASFRLKGNEEVTVDVPPPRPADLAPEDLPLRILFQDDHLIVVEKPSGMVVHPAPGHAGGTLVNALLACTGRLSGIGGVARPGIVHRLDRDTSGILVAAKTDEAHARLSAQFSTHREVDRRYHGIVRGRPKRPEGKVETRIGRHPAHRKKMAVLPEGGRQAVTRYRVVESFGSFSLVEFRLATGRTHQVRVHCAHLSCPIVGDEVYGGGRKVALSKGRSAPTVTLDRFFLHAFHLGFVHPVTGERMEFTVPDPPEFAAFRAAVLEANE
ncbi:MAG: RluA family pseudouridine synthase [Deltaproteobacteria bacterium]|nr:RluA family pseudouridine synthase [Deltaproteobacteria bacterium]